MKLSQEIAAISDDTKDELEKFNLYMKKLLQQIIKEGQQTGEFSKGFDPTVIANLFFSSCQGMAYFGLLLFG